MLNIVEHFQHLTCDINRLELNLYKLKLLSMVTKLY